MVILKTNRESYDAETSASKSITIKEFIELLQEMGKDEKIILSNDGGYTYGVINEHSFGII
jgi:hypothetical protein